MTSDFDIIRSIMHERLYSVARQLVPKEHRPIIRRKIYDLQDLVGFGIPNLIRYGKFDMFQWVNFELNGNCNWNKCWYCANSVTSGRNGIMSDEVHNAMIMQLSEIGRAGFQGTMTPTFFGEPTIYGERLAEKVQQTRKCLPRTNILIQTNGILLTQELYRLLVNAGVDRFIVTRHPKAPMENFDRLLAQLSDQEKERIIDRTLDDIMLFERLPYIKIPPDRVLHLQRCPLSSNQLTIAFNGDVLFCCSNFDANPVFGNIMDRSISEIWEDTNFKTERDNTRRGIFSLPACRVCMGKEL